MALNGTREGLYNAAMALCPETKNGQKPVDPDAEPVLSGLYGGGAVGRGRAGYVPATAGDRAFAGYAALPADVLNRTAIAYICSPANPQGAVATAQYWAT